MADDCMKEVVIFPSSEETVLKEKPSLHRSIKPMEVNKISPTIDELLQKEAEKKPNKRLTSLPYGFGEEVIAPELPTNKPDVYGPIIIEPKTMRHAMRGTPGKIDEYLHPQPDQYTPAEVEAILKGYREKFSSIAGVSTRALEDQQDERLTSLNETQKAIHDVCMDMSAFLIAKNRKYGDSVCNPVRCFSKASMLEQINVRLDDKISRIMSAQHDDIEDAEKDLLGYLIIKRVAIQKRQKLTLEAD